MQTKKSQFFDKLLKFIIGNNLTSFFLFFGINCFPFFPISNELLDNNLNKSLLDYPVYTWNGIVNIEFQQRTKESDKKRFLRYVGQLYEKYGISIYSVVIDFNIKKDKTEIIWINRRDKFTIYFKSLIERNAMKILNNINYKIENKIRITGAELVALELLPLLDPSRKLELLKQASELVFKLNDEVLSYEKIRELRDVLLNYAYYWNEDEILMKLGKGSEMDENFCEDALKRYGQLSKEEGREEGREELSYEIANELIQEGYKAEEVSKISHLDLKIVNQLMIMK